MEIKTKYNIGDTLWVIYDNKAQTITVSNISIVVYPDNKISINYIDTVGSDTYDYKGTFPEDECFPSKEELKESL